MSDENTEPEEEIPPHIESLLKSPETQAYSVVARNANGGLMATEIGVEELDREVLIELAAYHLVSLEDDLGEDPSEVVRDVVNKRNELNDRPVGGVGGLSR